ncbi:hypothetical protein PR202_ga19299 [Eleusine coracana subsp. coracana]|uniref:Uncharacterized protein n=1 Tax=Eleusine coracana subsp. coracana TaxID=191504 RepID=A0AAV5CUB2_ELECO|nr:hypothetical protein PR202_ga19299 [Eleusine coracana subsp. coracana]
MGRGTPHAMPRHGSSILLCQAPVHHMVLCFPGQNTSPNHEIRTANGYFSHGPASFLGGKRFPGPCVSLVLNEGTPAGLAETKTNLN